MMDSALPSFPFLDKFTAFQTEADSKYRFTFTIVQPFSGKISQWAVNKNLAVKK